MPAAYDFDHPNSIDNNALVECLTDLRVSSLALSSGACAPCMPAFGTPCANPCDWFHDAVAASINTKQNPRNGLTSTSRLGEARGKLTLRECQSLYSQMRTSGISQLYVTGAQNMRGVDVPIYDVCMSQDRHLVTNT